MNEKSARRLKVATIAASGILIAISLGFPAFTIRDYDGPRTSEGFELFLTGGFAILGGGFLEWIVWLANPLYVAGLVLLIRSAALAKVLAGWAAILALSFAVWHDVLAAESGRTAPITARHAGYWLWTAGILVLAIGSRTVLRTDAAAENGEGSDREVKPG